MEPFRLRLNCIDHYLSWPTKFEPQITAFDHVPTDLRPPIPIVRVFGTTETGQKVCAHIHGFFPYLYIEYNGSLIPDEVATYIHRLRSSIDKAMNTDARTKQEIKFVAHISLVKGVPFFGFNVGYHFYFKIYLLDPRKITRCADSLRNGSILSTIFLPYEAHMQYVPQFMCDYNLFGCDYLEARKMIFRSPVPRQSSWAGQSHRWHNLSIPPEFISSETELQKHSYSELEVDICVQDIVNRDSVGERSIHQDFVERLNPMPGDVKLVHSMAGLWKEEARRRTAAKIKSPTGDGPFPQEALVSMSAESRVTQNGGWIHEKEFFAEIRKMANSERGMDDTHELTFESYVKKTPFEKLVQTASQSVAELHPGHEHVGMLASEINDKLTQLAADVDWDNAGMDEMQLSQAYERANSQATYLDDDYESDEEKAREVALSQRALAQLPGNGTPRASPRWTPRQSPRTSHKPYTPSPTKDRPQVKRVLFKGLDIETMTQREKKDVGLMEYNASQSTPELPDFDTTDPDSSGNSETTIKDEVDRPQEGSTSRPAGIYPILKRKAGVQASSPVKRPKVESPMVQNSPPRSPFRLLPSPGPSEDHHEEQKIVEQSAPHQALTPSRLRTSFQPESPESPSTVIKGSRRLQSYEIGNLVQGLQSSARTAWPAANGSAQRPKNPPSVTSTGAMLSDSFSHDGLDKLRRNPASVKGLQEEPRRSLPRANGDTVAPNKQTELPSFGSSSMTVVPLGSSANDSTLPPSSMEKVADKIATRFQDANTPLLTIYSEQPPSTHTVNQSLVEYQLNEIIYQDPYYGDPSDVPDRTREYAGQEFRLGSKTVQYLPEFSPFGGPSARALNNDGLHRAGLLPPKSTKIPHISSWEIAVPPPPWTEVVRWQVSQDSGSRPDDDGIKIEKRPLVVPRYPLMISQLAIPTQKNKHGFKTSQKQQGASIIQESGYMSVMAMECFACSRGKFLSHPSRDEISCIMWCFEGDTEQFPKNGKREKTHVGIIVKSTENINVANLAASTGFFVEEEETELDMMNRFVDIVRICDPDIVTGYEIHTQSWGYFVERGLIGYEINFLEEFSRARFHSSTEFGRTANRWGYNTTAAILITGRHVVNIWRVMRGDLNLLQYTFENVVFHLLHQRVPHYHPSDLTEWYRSKRSRSSYRTIQYHTDRVQLNLELLDEHEFIPRTSEQARLLGVDWYAVSARGSQFKVESIMFRIGKPENFMLPSPSRRQVGGQNALECLPLVMEPQSGFYTSPMLVLDFQSLYPSVMIAYNFCYSTFLGRITPWRGMNKMGFTDYRRAPRVLELLQDHLNVTPNGMIYVKPTIRRSLLAKMLSEILETRIMVKSGMKQEKDNRPLQRLLNNRQLALKLLANVTYGYTSASFSGRMPCSEIADSIVQTGRETLEKAIALIHSVKRWDAEVVYGDTDSLFIYLKGRSKDTAFDIGQEIADAVTKMNPRPIKLKFEKVYLPCVLLAKKRYVGFKYESKSQKEPEWDAKGIETVRRDGTPGQQKLLEACLKILFRTSDLSRVKTHFQDQCAKLVAGRFSVQDFVFAKEVKLGTYADGHLPPAGALIATKRMQLDPMLEPQYGERVPYLVVAGAPGSRLIDRCLDPEALLNDPQKEVDREYYISKTWIPTLERVFNLVGGNVRAWWDEMPKRVRLRRIEVAYSDEEGDDGERGGAGRGPSRPVTRGIFGTVDVRKRTLENYMRTSSCLVCGARFQTPPPAKLVNGATRRARRPKVVAENLCRACSSSTSFTSLPNSAIPPAPPTATTTRCNAARSLLVLRQRLGRRQADVEDVAAVCRSCAALDRTEEVRCDSRDCPVFYTRNRLETRLRYEGRGLVRVIGGLEGMVGDW